MSFLINNQFSIKYRCPFQMLLFYRKITKSVTLGSVSIEKVVEKSKTPRKTVGLNYYISISIENKDFKITKFEYKVYYGLWK